MYGRNAVLIVGTSRDPKDVLVRQFIIEQMKKGTSVLYVLLQGHADHAISALIGQGANLSEKNFRLIDCTSKNGTGKHPFVHQLDDDNELVAINAALTDALRAFGDNAAVAFDAVTPLLLRHRLSLLRKFFELMTLKLNVAGASRFFLVDSDKLLQKHLDVLTGLTDKTVMFGRDKSGTFIMINNEQRIGYRQHHDAIEFQDEW